MRFCVPCETGMKIHSLAFFECMYGLILTRFVQRVTRLHSSDCVKLTWARKNRSDVNIRDSLIVLYSWYHSKNWSKSTTAEQCRIGHCAVRTLYVICIIIVSILSYRLIAKTCTTSHFTLAEIRWFCFRIHQLSHQLDNAGIYCFIYYSRISERRMTIATKMDQPNRYEKKKNDAQKWWHEMWPHERFQCILAVFLIQLLPCC